MTRRKSNDGIPLWLTVLADLVVLGLLVFNVTQHPEAVGTTMMLGGLVGGIHGVDKLLKSKDDEK